MSRRHSQEILPADEQQRVNDIIRILPVGRRSILEIGARHGMLTRILCEHYQEITALDLERPTFVIDKVMTVKGDVTRLEFADNAFDVVLCTEVLEHVSHEKVAQACQELARVARHEVLIGVPYKQDIRLHRMDCRACGKKNPAYGHVNCFDIPDLERLFAGMTRRHLSIVGPDSPRTNAVSTWLMDLAGNPWGTYDQEEACVYCGAALQRPGSRNILQKFAGKVASILTRIQNRLFKMQPYWIHMIYTKDSR